MNGTQVHRVPLLHIDSRLPQLVVFALLAPLYVMWYRRRFQILHSFANSFITIPSMVMAKSMGKRVLVESTLMKPRRNVESPGLREKAENMFLGAWDAYVGISNPVIQQLIGAGAPPARVRLLPPSVDTESYSPAMPDVRRALRARHGYGEDDVVICNVGAIMPRKGTDILVKAFTLLPRGAYNYHLLLVGEYGSSGELGSFKDDLVDVLQESGLISNVTFTGHVDESERIADHLRLSDLFAFPSLREGLGTAILEAMSVGLPCITGAMDGVAFDVIDSGRNGIILDSYDPSDWAEAIERLTNDPIERRTLGAAARNEVLERFSRGPAVDRQLDLYFGILQKGHK